MLVFEIEIDTCKVVIVFALGHGAASLLELVTVVRFLSSSVLSWWPSTSGWVWLLWSLSELAMLSSKKAPTLVSEPARASSFLLLSSGVHHLRIWLRRRMHARIWRSRVSTVVEGASVVSLLTVGAISAWSVLSLTSLS